MPDTGNPIRSLFVSTVTPWPEQSGNRRRMSSVLRALSAVGPVDAYLMTDQQMVPPDEVPVREVAWGPVPTTSHGPIDEVLWLLRRARRPSDLVGLDARSASGALRDWIRRTGHEYDFVWCGRPRAYLATRGVVPATTIVDLDDLEDRKLIGRLESGVTEEGMWGGPRVPGWRRLARYKTVKNVSGWRNLHAELATEVTGLALCSEEDRVQSGLRRSIVVPNCYPAPVTQTGAAVTQAAPTFLLIGLMTYRPNADGAAWFVRDVLPTIRSATPDAKVRIVGEAGDQVRALGEVPGVTVTGRVSSVHDELRQAAVSVVPIRFGGGTRVKILEAWAHRIPVVSTTQGAAGLGAVDGEHLLLADDARSFAKACVQALVDASLRDRLVSAGAGLHRDRFTCERVERALADDVRRLVIS